MQRYKPEQIVTVLRQIEVAVANGKSTPQACKEAGIHTQTYYRWRERRSGPLTAEQQDLPIPTVDPRVVLPRPGVALVPCRL